MPPSPSSPKLPRILADRGLAESELGDEDLRYRVKRELRKRALGLRKTTPLEACDGRSALIVAKLEALDPLRAARSVALFWPIVARHEIDLRPLDEALRRRGVRVAYPAIEPSAEAPHRMTFRFVEDVSGLEERGFGFSEPPLDAFPVSADLREIDVVVVPALALDPTGQRIGYGVGYYDRALKGTATTKVGVIYDFQLVPEVPATRGDVPVDWVVTDRRAFSAMPTEPPRIEGLPGASPDTEPPCPL